VLRPMEEVYLFDHFHEGSPVETTATGTAQVWEATITITI
jgi:hypothetical protein